MKRSKRIGSSARSSQSRPRKRQTIEELRSLQRLMASAVMRPLTPAQGTQPRWIDGRATKEVAASFIKPNERSTSFDRLEIYNRQYWFRVIDCFFDDYLGLRAVLGQQKFLKLTLAYLERHPSTRFTLRDLGQYLIGFIKSEPMWTKPRQQLALEMARLEWAHIEAFDEESRPPLRLEDLAGRKPSEIFLRLQPHITLLVLNYPLDDFLISLRRNTGLRNEASNAVESSRKTGGKRLVCPRSRRPVHLAVHRHRNRVYYKRLKPAQYEILFALQNGSSLEEALQATSRNIVPRRIQQWFEDWSILGWFWLEK